MANTAPQVQKLSQIIAESNAAYDPSRKLIQQQQAALGAKYDPQITGLDTAKSNAFIDINRGATGKGLAFSGIPVEEQTRYIGEKYLPARAGLLAQRNTENMNLTQTLAEIAKEQRLRGMDTREQQSTRLQDYLKEQRQMQFEREKMAQQARESALDRSASSARSSSSNPAAPTLTKNKNGGYSVSGGYDLAGYARATGKDLISLLANGDKQDKLAAKYYRDNIDLGRGEAYAMQRLQGYDRPTAFYRGG